MMAFLDCSPQELQVTAYWVQKTSYTDAGTDDTIEPELAGDLQHAIEDDDKDDDGGMKTAGETDAVNAAKSS